MASHHKVFMFEHSNNKSENTLTFVSYYFFDLWNIVISFFFCWALYIVHLHISNIIMSIKIVNLLRITEFLDFSHCPVF
jgi:hypothetical protein